jgi:uncharacterized protein YdaU (DUF1376 family)
LHYYTFNIGDYRRDTTHLTLLEHGIYRQLIDTYYLSEQPLCADHATLMRTHCVRTEEEQKALESVLKDFFDLVDGVYRHKGCDKNIGQYREKSEKASNSAKARWEKNANALPTQCERNAIGMLTNNQEPLTNNQDKTSLGKFVPNCPHQQVVDLFHQVLPELPKVKIWNTTRQAYLKSRWREMAAQENWETAEQGLEWFKKFFDWIRKSSFLMGKVSSKDRRPFECELEWLLKLNNFTKVMEGKYHAG